MSTVFSEVNGTPTWITAGKKQTSNLKQLNKTHKQNTHFSNNKGKKKRTGILSKKS